MLPVGDGNLSVSHSLVEIAPDCAANIWSTAFETVACVPDETLATGQTLAKSGAVVQFGIDATKLEQSFPDSFFQTIVFQFPNTGSRASADGFTSNHRLVLDFLCSASRVLSVGGKVIVTIVDTAYYLGAFDLERAADRSGYRLESAHPFYRSHFDYYQHSNTRPGASALQSYRRCTTYVFVRSPW